MKTDMKSWQIAKKVNVLLKRNRTLMEALNEIGKQMDPQVPGQTLYSQLRRDGFELQKTVIRRVI